MISSSPSQNAGTEKPTNATRFAQPIQDAAGPRRGPDPGRHGDHQGKHEAGPHQQQRVGQALAKHFDRRHGVEPRVAEIALCRATEPAQPPLEQRPIEPLQRLEPGGIGRGQRRVGLQHQVDRVAGHEADQAVDDEGDEQQDERTLGQAPDEEGGHARTRPPPNVAANLRRRASARPTT